MTKTSAIRAGGLLFLAVMILVASAGQAGAVVVAGNTGNTTAPPDDPGWSNMGVPYYYDDDLWKKGASAVYLGYRWVLTANHVRAGAVELGDTFYEMESGTTHRLKNPVDPYLSEYTDLKLFRLQESPRLAAIPIASSTPAVGQQITMIGKGSNCREDTTYWDVVKHSSSDWTWTETEPPGYDYAGFKYSSGGNMRWGTNVIDATGINVDLGGTNVISMRTDFDEFGGTDDECQVAGGDSGGGVFHENGDTWELAGILNATSRYPNQPGVVFTTKSYFADISHYRDQILDIIMPIPGDANLDYVVNDLDAAIMAAHWQMTSGAIWECGDFNGDGAVNDLDASILVQHWHETDPREGNNPSPVPEPTVLVLLAGGFLSLVLWRWRQRTVGG
jgi:hypothetical protein